MGMSDLVTQATKEQVEDLAHAMPSPLWTKAVEFLRGYIHDDVKLQIEHLVKVKDPNWPSAYHSYWGMGVRNALREHGFYEDAWPIRNLDNVYVELIEEAIR